MPMYYCTIGQHLVPNLNNYRIVKTYLQKKLTVIFKMALNWIQRINLNSWSRHQTVRHVKSFWNSVSGYAMRSVTIGKVERTVVTGFAHRDKLFHNEYVVTSLRGLFSVTESATGMFCPIVSVCLHPEIIFITNIQKCLNECCFV